MMFDNKQPHLLKEDNKSLSPLPEPFGGMGSELQLVCKSHLQAAKYEWFLASLEELLEKMHIPVKVPICSTESPHLI